MIEPCQQHGEDAGEKDAVEGAGAADRRNWRAKTLHLVEIGEVGTDQNIKFTDRTRCLSIRNRASGFAAATKFRRLEWRSRTTSDFQCGGLLVLPIFW